MSANSDAARPLGPGLAEQKASRDSNAGVGWPRDLLLVVLAALLGLVFADALIELEAVWRKKLEYSHGYMIPPISLWLALARAHAIQAEAMRGRIKGHWSGPLLVMVGLALAALGDLATIYVVVQFCLLLVLAGILIGGWGFVALRIMLLPLLFLAMMIPLPPFLYNQLSGALQLISSELGVAIIRAMNIGVFLEGNVIDLGVYKLHVVEACSGLRYLFPLASFGLLVACFYRGPNWQRVLLVVSTAPIAVLMNGVRIAIIGALVEHYGIGAAEGFLHDFEGWAVFMTCVAVLAFEAWLLNRIFGDGRSFSKMVVVDGPSNVGATLRMLSRTSSGEHLRACTVLMAAAALLSIAVGGREEAALERDSLSELRLDVDGYQRRDDVIPGRLLRALDLTDYALSNYIASSGEPVNLYVAFYASQRKGESAHSPRSCIPGGGWELTTLEQHTVPRTAGSQIESSEPLTVNRGVITRGEQQQLVYYWFKQRDRLLTNEYLVKWYLLWDAVTDNRTDGALVRLTTPVMDGNVTKADQVLSNFARRLDVALPRHVPD